MPQNTHTKTPTSFYSRIESEIGNYISLSIEISPGVFFSQYRTINRIYKFKNRDLSGSKINEDLSYNYYYDIISPRADNEVKNLRFDTKNIIAFSRNPRKDFAAVFIANSQLKTWMAENGEDDKLKAAVEEFTSNGNIGFKRIDGGYEIVDALNTIITNQKAESINDTDVIERHEMTASQLKAMEGWDYVDEVIKDLGNKSFTAAELTTPITTTTKRYEIFEYTGEMSELEYNELKGIDGGDEHKYFLAKAVVAGLRNSGGGKKYTLFCEQLDGDMEDHYIYAHRGRYEGRFWRIGMYEMLFDHQIRCNEIGNQLASGLEWASKVIFKSRDNKILQNIRADMVNGDIINTEDLSQVDVRMQNMDQLIADWNRVNQDADRLANSSEVSRGDAPPSGTPFRMGVLLDQNSGKLFVLIRQKITLPYKRVFREWILPELVKDLKAQDVYRLVGETDMLDQLREIMVESWYVQNLVKIGPHTQEIADSIKAEKLQELQKVDPVIENSKEIWSNVLPRIFITITGENSDIADQIQDMTTLLNYEKDPDRINWILDTIYKSRGIPIPPVKKPEPPTPQEQMMMQQPTGGAPSAQPPGGNSQPPDQAAPVQ